MTAALPTSGTCPLGHTPDQHRHLDGLEADLRSARRALTEALAERDAAREAARSHFRALRRQLLAALDRPDDNRTTLAEYISALTAELAEARALIARLRDHDEQRDRIWAGHTSGQES